MSSDKSRTDSAAHMLELRPDVKRRAIFILLAILGGATLLLGVILGNPETIHRFAAQI